MRLYFTKENGEKVYLKESAKSRAELFVKSGLQNSVEKAGETYLISGVKADYNSLSFYVRRYLPFFVCILLLPFDTFMSMLYSLAAVFIGNVIFNKSKVDYFNDSTLGGADAFTDLRDVLLQLVGKSHLIMLNANDFFARGEANHVNLDPEDLKWAMPVLLKYPKSGINALMAYIQRKNPLDKFMDEEYSKALQAFKDRNPEEVWSREYD